MATVLENMATREASSSNVGSVLDEGLESCRHDGELVMDDVQKQQIFSAVRTIVAYMIGQLVAKGMVDSTIGDQLVGLVGLAVPLVWGMMEKVSTKKKEDARAVNAVNVGVTITNPQAPMLSPKDAKAVEAEVAPIIQANKGELK